MDMKKGRAKKAKLENSLLEAILSAFCLPGADPGTPPSGEEALASEAEKRGWASCDAARSLARASVPFGQNRFGIPVWG